MTRRLRALFATFGMVVAGAVVGEARHDASAAGTAPVTLFDLSLARVPSGARSGTAVTPRVGPRATVVVRGSGAVVASGTGRVFRKGGQQRDHTAFVTIGGRAATNLFSPSRGSFSVTATSRVGLSKRRSLTGRRSTGLVHLTNGRVEGSDGLAFGVSVNYDADPYLAVTVNGVGTAVALTPARAALFGAGKRYTITTAWSAGMVTVALNGAQVAKYRAPTTRPAYTSRTRFTIGASADYGGGYFSAVDDAIERVVVTGAPITPPPPTTAPPTTQPTTTTPGGYPSQWEWATGFTDAQPLPATTGTPLIKQIRNGVVIATYTRLGEGPGCEARENSQDDPATSCGAFPTHHVYANKRPGDIFEVYPAVYQGADQQPNIAEMYANYPNALAGIAVQPDNITIRGVTVNGRRPVIRLNGDGASYNNLNQSIVYVSAGTNVTIENIDLDGGTAGGVGKAGIYINGGRNVTLRNMRIHGFRRAGANGIFSTGNAAGTLTLDRVQLYANGGDSGPEHNAYLNASDVDPNFTVRMVNSYSTDVYYGHTFKSRAQINVLEGNYFRGTTPAVGFAQAEAFLVDIPNGARLTMRNNVLVKNRSGDSSNGGFLTYAFEGTTDHPRPLSLLIEHNTFVAFSDVYDSQQHPLWPMGFFYPNQRPDAAGFPIANPVVRNNVFVGFVPFGDGNPLDYRGQNALVVGFDELRRDYGLVHPVAAPTGGIIGTRMYDHRTKPATRTKATLGARD